MKKASLSLLLLLSLVFEIGCSGSGAVSPLSPSKASQPDSSNTSADSDVVYWTAYPVTFTLSDALNGVCLVSKKLGWACGNSGVVLKYDGETWNKVDTGLAKNENLMAVAFANENEGWIAGSHGTILHYSNGTWSLDDSQTQELLYSLAVTRAKTVWATGSNGTLLTYNGVSWGKVGAFSSAASAAATITDDIYGISLSDQNNGWAVGNRGLILRYDGQKWQSYSASPSTERLNSVSAINDVQAWIVGAYGTILRFNGTAWNKMGSAFSGFDLYQIFMKSDDDGWAVGQDGTLVYYDGSRWISHKKPDGKPSLNSIAFYKDVGFIVGQNGSILKYQPNGEMAKFTFLFKGLITKSPTKSNPYWTLTYTLMNQSPKASPLVTFELPMPKGLEPYLPSPTPTPNGTVSPTLTPTATPTVTATPAGSAPSGSVSTLGKSEDHNPRPAAGVAGSWKMKDNNLEWEIGNVSASEIKTLTLMIQEKKGEKREEPLLLKAVLKSTDKVIAEAVPVTFQIGDSKTNAVGPTVTTHSDKGDNTNAQPAATPGN